MECRGVNVWAKIFAGQENSCGALGDETDMVMGLAKIGRGSVRDKFQKGNYVWTTRRTNNSAQNEIKSDHPPEQC